MRRVRHWRSLLKSLAAQSDVSKHLQGKWARMESCTSNRDDHRFKRIVRKGQFKKGVDCGWCQSTTHRFCKERGFNCCIPNMKPLLCQRQHQKHLTWAKEKQNWTVALWSKVFFSHQSKFCISFGNQCPRVCREYGDAQNPRCLKFSVKFRQSVMIWEAVSSAGFGGDWYTGSDQVQSTRRVYQEFSEHFPLPSAKSFMEMLIASWHLPKLIANDLPQTSTTQRIYRAIRQHSNHFCIVNPLLIYLRTYSNNLLYTISLCCNLHIYAVIYGILSNRQRFLPILQWTIMLLEKTAVMMWCSEFFISRWRHSWLLHKSIIKQILSVLLGKLWRNLVCLKKQTYSNWQQDLWAFPFMPAGLVSLRISGLDIRITVLHDKKKSFILCRLCWSRSLY